MRQKDLHPLSVALAVALQAMSAWADGYWTPLDPGARPSTRQGHSTVSPGTLPPDSVTASDGSYSDKVRIAWSASSGAISYEVYRNISNSSVGPTLLGSPSASPFDDTTASPATIYYYFVKACNGAACSNFSASDSGYRSGVPLNDDFAGAIPLGTVPFLSGVDVTNATTAGNDPPLTACSRPAGTKSVWYSYAPSTSRLVYLDTFGSVYDTMIGVFTGTLGSLTPVACNDDDSRGGVQSGLALNATAGTTYHIVVYSKAAVTTAMLQFHATTFYDVPGSHSFWPYIEGFYGQGITTGCSTTPFSYCPDNPVTRAAMAVFLLRAMHGSSWQPPATTGIFADLPVAGKEWMQPWVEEFYRDGITTGCASSPLRYCPETSVTRAAMAVFVLRSIKGTSYTPPPATGIFADLPVAGKEWMQPWVEEFYREGITTGCGTNPLRYCPENPVTRGAMATFISRAYAIPQLPSCETPTTWFRDLDGDGYGDISHAISSCITPPGYVVVNGDCDDRDSLRHPGPTTDPGFVYGRCGQGRVVDAMSTPAGWTQYLSVDNGTGSGEMTGEPGGCLGGNSLVFTYDLPSPTTCGNAQCSWVVMRKQLSTPINLSGEDYLVFPFNGDTGDPNLNVEIKLQDSDDCMIAYQVRNATDLPAKRAMVIPLKWYSMARTGQCSVNLSAVKAVEIAVVGEPPSAGFPDDTGRLHLDAVTALRASEIRTDSSYFTCPGDDAGAKSRIAQDLLTRHKTSLASKGHPFVTSWFEEPTANYWTYTQALLLLVFTLEGARTGNEEFRTAAAEVADQLVALQQAVTSGPGRWYDLYQDRVPGPGLMPAGDLAFSWFGNTSWVVIALDVFRTLARPADSQPYDAAIDQAADWLNLKIDAYGTSGGITEGTEGNVSTFFALVASRQFSRALKMRDYLLANHWHADEQRFWMGVHDPGLAIDVAGNWGSEFLRAVGETDKALAGLALAAGTFPVRSFDGQKIGLGDIAGPWQPCVEFTGQAISSGVSGSPFLLSEILKLESNGTWPGSPDDFDGGAGWNTAWHGIAPSAWVYLALSPADFALHRLALPLLADDFETDSGWGNFEEIVVPSCYAENLGEVARSTDIALSGATSLRVWANKTATTKSNHLIANKKLSTSGQSGIWHLEFDSYIPADGAMKGQSGPEASLQNTRQIESGVFRTSTAGIQYVANDADSNFGTWGVWAEAATGLARWTFSPTRAKQLSAGVWYHVELIADYDTNRYVSLTIRNGSGETTTFDLSSYKIAAEPKFTEEAFWVTVESENMWNNCGAAQATQYRVYYDNVVARR